MERNFKETLKVAIVGGSIAGLAAATAFIRLGALVKVFEKSSTYFEGKGGRIGFCDIGLWERLSGRQMLRLGKQAHRSQGAFVYGDLWNFWYSGLPKNTVSFNCTVTDIGSVESPTIEGESYDIVIVADGGWSMLRSKYFESTQPDFAGYQAWRFRVAAANVTPQFKALGQYTNGHYATILLDILKNDGELWYMGGTAIACEEDEVIIKPEAGANRQAMLDDPNTANDSTEYFMRFYKKTFGDYENGELLRLMQAAAKYGKITPLPQYEFCAKKVVQGRVILIGDAAHMASPRTAVGAHTAVLDAEALLEAFAPLMNQAAKIGLDKVVEKGIKAYEPLALERAQQLYNRTRQVSSEVVSPGWTLKIKNK